MRRRRRVERSRECGRRTARHIRSTRGRVLRDRASAIVVLVGLVVVPVSAFGVGPWVLGQYDDEHRVNVVCRVRSVAAEVHSSRGGSQPQVNFHTDCGNLLWVGVNRSNMNDVASAVNAGAEYRFELGAGSFKLRKMLKVVKVVPTIYRYAEVPG